MIAAADYEARLSTKLFFDRETSGGPTGGPYRLRLVHCVSRSILVAQSGLRFTSNREGVCGTPGYIPPETWRRAHSFSLLFRS